jgi:hypothetical protein
VRSLLRSEWFWVAVVVAACPVVLALLPAGDELRPPLGELAITWLLVATAAVLVGAVVTAVRRGAASRRR